MPKRPTPVTLSVFTITARSISATAFTQGEEIRFTGIPNFAPEIFRRAVLKDPLRLKALQKGLAQLCEEGATQLFKPLRNNDLILGAVGPLQFDVVAHRLRDEYNVECQFETINVATARWVECDDPKMLATSRRKHMTTSRWITATVWSTLLPRG